MKLFQVPEQLFQATLNYLSTKPYNEVNQLIQAIAGSVRVVEIPDAQPAPPEKTSDGDKNGA